MTDIAVLGIDPGSQRTGWGLVREASGVLSIVECGIIRTGTANGSFSSRLAIIFRELQKVMHKFGPGEAAIEQVFTAKNAASALKLGQARGAAVAACASCGLEVHDYEPTLVKKTIAGVGRAEKKQVAFMVGRLLGISPAGFALDTTDALAVAICHLTHRRFRRLEAIGTVVTPGIRSRHAAAKSM